VALAGGDRIQLLVSEGEAAYEVFAEVLEGIARDGCMVWKGDVDSKDGGQSSGLIVARKPGRHVRDDVKTMVEWCKVRPSVESDGEAAIETEGGQ
jgi:hypothetical protein